jgi:hypothetical protein
VVSEHSVTPAREVYFQCVLELDNQHQFASIFLACDEVETIQLFQDYFHDRLIYNDVYRVPQDSDMTVHHLDRNIEPPRPFHRYLLGKEVLIDALMLARCGHFLCGPSTVAHAVMFFSTDQQIIHEVQSPGIYIDETK